MTVVIPKGGKMQTHAVWYYVFGIIFYIFSLKKCSVSENINVITSMRILGIILILIAGVLAFLCLYNLVKFS